MKVGGKEQAPVINLVIKVSLPADFSDPVGAGTPRFQGPLRPASKDSELATTLSTTLFLVLDLSAQLSNHNYSQTYARCVPERHGNYRKSHQMGCPTSVTCIRYSHTIWLWQVDRYEEKFLPSCHVNGNVSYQRV